MPDSGYLLLVEDNPGDAGLTRALVDEAQPIDGSPMRWVQSIDAAQHVLVAEPDCLVVLLDLGLPDSQGLQALHRLAPHLSDCPVIVLTGDGDEALGTAAVAAGAQDFLVKGSFDADQLRRTIRFASQRKRLQRREIDRVRQAALDDAVAARNLLRDVLARVGDGFAALDRDWRYTYANAQAARMMRHERAEDIVGRLLWDEYPDLSGSATGERLRLAASTQRPDVFDLYHAPWSRWFEIRVHPGPEGVSLYFSDITDRHRSERSILAFQAELSQLAQRLLMQERVTTQRLALALHDRLGQTLAIARLESEALVARSDRLTPPELAVSGGRITAQIERAIQEVRQVLADLRPPMLEDLGLVAALDNEVKGHDRGHAGPDVLLEAEEGAIALRWPGDVEYAAFMVAREAVANALQHAGASLVRVVVGGTGRSLSVQVIDDGAGIAPDLSRGRPGHLGLVGMRERSMAIGARFSIGPGPQGGTLATLDWEAPVP
jgi:signal transduction histidine kinase